ncbi:AtpZ/AtpI family protein [Hyphococcus sp. DH-69]|uniref:AtpZ/AtpI family protein n=1 Tax=Hyphococcus formosus TaxID=3143534 RepID=UPI00398B0E96
MGEDTGRDEANNDRPPSLDEFSERLDRMRGTGKVPNANASGPAWGRALRVSSDLLAGLIVGGFLGWGLDYWLGTSPWLLLLGLGLGFAAGLRNMMRTLKEDTEQSSGD